MSPTLIAAENSKIPQPKLGPAILGLRQPRQNVPKGYGRIMLEPQSTMRVPANREHVTPQPTFQGHVGKALPQTIEVQRHHQIPRLTSRKGLSEGARMKGKDVLGRPRLVMSAPVGTMNAIFRQAT